jgi:hypothetical protein
MEGTKTRTWQLKEGDYFAEVEVEIILDELGWSPGLAPEAEEKVGRVRAALRAGDIATALQYAKVYKLKLIAPIAGAGDL